MKLKKEILLLIIILFISIVAGIFNGSADIRIMELFSMENRYILYLRILRVLLGIFVGAGLAVCGVTLQAVLRNPLAEPYLLGASSGAGVGAVMAIILGLSSIYFPFAAFSGAVVTIILVYCLARENGRIPVQSLILAGVIVGISLSGIMVFLISVSGNQALHGVIWWMLGSLQMYDIKLLSIVGIIVLLGIAWIGILTQDLNAICIGEEEALHLGVNIEVIKKMLFFVTALITGALVSVSGMIGFVGLIIPHIMRLVVGPNHKILIPSACLGGAAFLVFCDTLSRTLVAPYEIPIGVVTSLVGAPIFIILLRRGQKVI